MVQVQHSRNPRVALSPRWRGKAHDAGADASRTESGASQPASTREERLEEMNTTAWHTQMIITLLLWCLMLAVWNCFQSYQIQDLNKRLIEITR